MIYVLSVLIIVWLFALQSKINNISRCINTITAKLNSISQASDDVDASDIMTQQLNEQESVQQNDANFEIIENRDSDINNLKQELNTKTFNFEAVFMGNIFNKIGAIAILVGIGVLVKLISSYIEFNDIMKISLGFLAGFGMIFAAFKMQITNKMKNFAEALMGTGFGSLLITTYCATSLMKVFSIPVATVIASLILIAIYFIADKQKTVSMLFVGLIGGYLNPFFINPYIDASFLFTYLIFLNLLSLIFVYRNPNKQKINIFNLILTTIVVTTYSASANMYSVYHCLALWGIYIVYDILMIRAERISSNVSKTQTYLNFGILALLTIVLFKANYNAIGLLLCVSAVVYSLLGIFSADKFEDRENSYLYSSLLSVFLCTYFWSNGLLRISFWALESLLTALFALKFEYKNLSKLSLLFFLSAIANVFFTKGIYDVRVYPTSLLNFIPPIVAGFFATQIFRKYNCKNYANLFRFLVITLLYALLMLVINSYIGNVYGNIYIKLLSYSILCFIYSLNISLHSFVSTEEKAYRTVGFFVYAVGILLMLCSEGFAPSDALPFLNFRLLTYGLAVGNLIFIIKKYNYEILKYIAVILGYAYIHFESANIVYSFEVLNINWLVSFMWTIYAGVISLFGIFKNKKFLKMSGIWLSIFVIIRLFLFDFAGLDMIFKLLAFLTLGIVLMLISYFYNKYKKEN